MNTTAPVVYYHVASKDPEAGVLEIDFSYRMRKPQADFHILADAPLTLEQNRAHLTSLADALIVALLNEENGCCVTKIGVKTYRLSIYWSTAVPYEKITDLLHKVVGAQGSRLVHRSPELKSTD